MQSNKSQITLIISGLLVALLFGVFLYREIFPEYKIYQNDYMALEEFRSTYTHKPPPTFQKGIKQIVIEREDKGPPVIDRCTSCHVALEIPYFSPTKIAHGPDGKMLLGPKGHPLQVQNEEYIWAKLEQTIKELRDPKVLENLKSLNDLGTVKERLAQADAYEALKTAKVGDHIYDVTKVLTMHPLMGHETRPFEYHALDDIGCIACHNGNGKGLVTDKAHGPVFDGDYDIEYEGPTPQFTESDPANDPRFAKIFNDKPGHELLFQTHPLFVGPLMQAKCLQCHRVEHKNISVTPSLEAHQKLNTDLKDFTKNYQRGEELFLSQACYACHRIAGLTRGGVGPELTQIGNSYPWYIKQSIVWPQADLRTSTMPNMRMDHVEIQDLMTFLLAQKGSSQAISPTTYKADLQAWEAGRKETWEKPVSPSKIDDLRYAMTVFATEGCASCHRLQGFDSNVGYKIEKDDPSFDQLYEQQKWFKKLFPEVISIFHYDEQFPGSSIVEQIEKHFKEIDERIVGDVRKNGLLEEIDQKHPETLESFYSPFRYASRAKNAYYETLEKAETDPKKITVLKTEHQVWQERVHRVMMMYIQTYGLGRLIGPHLNWTGIYRTDEWLMEHFHNPAAHVPRSLMPVFPFDDTKFYALTNMLDQLAIHNKNATREIWKNEGFNPSEAFAIHCAQCHGVGRQGNGTIAEWIYPVPKNLRNPDFLRNLTKEQAIHSIIHGVSGTPMSPWGEVAKDKPEEMQKKVDHSPVLTEGEIHYLVDWLYSTLPGGEVLKGDIPKWKYEPQDVLEDLKKEGGTLNALPEPQKHSKLEKKYHLSRSIAGFTLPLATVGSEKVEDLFDVIPSDSGDKYYIKKKYYTPQNIKQGQDFFMLNCSVCHGKEADGSGARAEAMQDAKPRMLTNLDWVQSRDDLRLLRSIKFGVLGTSMTPWGDFTNTLQRLQLVIFIRTLSDEHEQRESLAHLIYQVYDTSEMKVEGARVGISQELESLTHKQSQLDDQIAHIRREVLEGNSIPQEADKLYQQNLDREQNIGKLKTRDQIFLKIKAEIKNERSLYQGLGLALISKDLGDEMLKSYFKMIELNSQRYALVKGELVDQSEGSNTDKILALRKGIETQLQEKIALLEKNKNDQTEVDALKKIKTRLVTDTELALGSAKTQRELVKQLKSKN